MTLGREMAATQLRSWSGRELLKFADHVARIKEIAAETASVYVFHIHRGRVSITSKTRHLARILPKTMRRMLATRARSYEVLLRAALRHSRHDVSTVLAIDVGDLPRHYEETPIFSFQKRPGIAIFCSRIRTSIIGFGISGSSTPTRMKGKMCEPFSWAPRVVKSCGETILKGLLKVFRESISPRSFTATRW